MAIVERTADVEAALWERYARTRSDDDRNRLAEHYRWLVERIADKLADRLTLSGPLERDDLAAAGTFGLFDAIAAFDRARSIKFTTFAMLRIRGAMLDQVRDLDRVPRLERVRRKVAAPAIV